MSAQQVRRGPQSTAGGRALVGTGLAVRHTIQYASTVSPRAHEKGTVDFACTLGASCRYIPERVRDIVYPSITRHTNGYREEISSAFTCQAAWRSILIRGGRTRSRSSATDRERDDGRLSLGEGTTRVCNSVNQRFSTVLVNSAPCWIDCIASHRV